MPDTIFDTFTQPQIQATVENGLWLPLGSQRILLVQAGAPANVINISGNSLNFNGTNQIALLQYKADSIDISNLSTIMLRDIEFTTTATLKSALRLISANNDGDESLVKPITAPVTKWNLSDFTRIDMSKVSFIEISIESPNGNTQLRAGKLTSK